LLRQSIFGNIQQEELPDAITSLWKHRDLQRLDLEPYPIPPYSESARRLRMSRVPWNFGGGPVNIRLRSPDHCAR
jgi:hypothetical protein